mgnify:CR=1 FL=1
MSAAVGTVTAGTMRPQDLIPAFLVELRCHDRAAAEAISVKVPHDDLVKAGGVTLHDDHAWWHSEDADEVLSDLFNALDEHAPDGHYFGALEYDGSDFGFWPSNP